MKTLLLALILLSTQANALENPYYDEPIQLIPQISMYAENGIRIPTQNIPTTYYNDPYTGQLMNNKGEVCQDTGIRMICVYR